MKPDRAEPLYQLAKIHRLNGNPRLGYMFAKMAADIPYPANDILFIDENVYAWMVIDEFASTAFYMGDFQNGYYACEILIGKINKGQIPPEHHERIRSNHSAYADKLREIAAQELAAKQTTKEAQEQAKKRRLEQQKKNNESKKIAKNRSKEKARRRAKASQA